MNYNKGFVSMFALLVVLGIIVLGGVGYVAINPQVLKAPAPMATTTDQAHVQTAPGDHPEEDHDANDGVAANAKVSISWKFTDAGEAQGIPYTKVTAVINGTSHEMGKFQGSCKEVSAKGGIDGKGLLAGELSAAQCYFAGGGDEVAVFANEDGGVDLMVGELQEPMEGSAGFRGNFKVKTALPKL